MKKALLLIPFLFSLVLLSNAQEYFSSVYNNSGNDSIADGYITVKYHGHANPVKYSIVLGAVVYGTDDFFDVTADTIVLGDSVNNIVISSMGSLTQVPGAFEGFKAYAIDSMTLDTLGVVLSNETGDSYNELGLISIDSSLNCDGAFVIDTLAYYGVSSNANNNSYLSNQLTRRTTYASGNVTNIFHENNQNDISRFPAFEGSNLCPGYYEFASSRGFIVSFTITGHGSGVTGGTGSSGFSAADVVVTRHPYIDCYNSASVAVNDSAGPYTYSWDGAVFDTNSVKSNLCSGGHSLRVANSFGDTVSINHHVQTLTFIVRSSTYTNCLGKAEITFQANYIDTSSFLFSWDDNPYSSEANVDSLCVGSHTLSIIDSLGDTLIQSFSIQLFDFAISTHSVVNNCDGFAYVYHRSFLADTVLYSWDGAPYTNYENSLSNICEGFHTLFMTGSVLQNDTLVVPFAIANTQNTYTNSYNSDADSVSISYETCLIDYSSIVDSIFINNLTYIDSFNLSFEVAVWQSGTLAIVTDTILAPVYELNSLNVMFTFYCAQKSNIQVIKVIGFYEETVGVYSFIESVEKEASLSIFPNPVSNVLTIDVNINDDFIVGLYNSNGQLILTSKENSLDVSSLPKGLYLLKYTSETLNKTIKVIKN